MLFIYYSLLFISVFAAPQVFQQHESNNYNASGLRLIPNVPKHHFQNQNNARNIITINEGNGAREGNNRIKNENNPYVNINNARKNSKQHLQQNQNLQPKIDMENIKNDLKKYGNDDFYQSILARYYNTSAKKNSINEPVRYYNSVKPYLREMNAQVPTYVKNTNLSRLFKNKNKQPDVKIVLKNEKPNQYEVQYDNNNFDPYTRYYFTEQIKKFKRNISTDNNSIETTTNYNKNNFIKKTNASLKNNKNHQASNLTQDILKPSESRQNVKMHQKRENKSNASNLKRENKNAPTDKKDNTIRLHQSGLKSVNKEMEASANFLKNEQQKMEHNDSNFDLDPEASKTNGQSFLVHYKMAPFLEVKKHQEVEPTKENLIKNEFPNLIRDILRGNNSYRSGILKPRDMKINDKIPRNFHKKNKKHANATHKSNRIDRNDQDAMDEDVKKINTNSYKRKQTKQDMITDSLMFFKANVTMAPYYENTSFKDPNVRYLFNPRNKGKSSEKLLNHERYSHITKGLGKKDVTLLKWVYRFLNEHSPTTPLYDDYNSKLYEKQTKAYVKKNITPKRDTLTPWFYHPQTTEERYENETVDYPVEDYKDKIVTEFPVSTIEWFGEDETTEPLLDEAQRAQRHKLQNLPRIGFPLNNVFGTDLTKYDPSLATTEEKSKQFNLLEFAAKIRNRGRIVANNSVTIDTEEYQRKLREKIWGTESVTTQLTNLEQDEQEKEAQKIIEIADVSPIPEVQKVQLPLITKPTNQARNLIPFPVKLRRTFSDPLMPPMRERALERLRMKTSSAIPFNDTKWAREIITRRYRDVREVTNEITTTELSSFSEISVKGKRANSLKLSVLFQRPQLPVSTTVENITTEQNIKKHFSLNPLEYLHKEEDNVTDIHNELLPKNRKKENADYDSLSMNFSDELEQMQKKKVLNTTTLSWNRYIVQAVLQENLRQLTSSNLPFLTPLYVERIEPEESKKINKYLTIKESTRDYPVTRGEREGFNDVLKYHLYSRPIGLQRLFKEKLRRAKLEQQRSLW